MRCDEIASGRRSKPRDFRWFRSGRPSAGIAAWVLGAMLLAGGPASGKQGDVPSRLLFTDALRIAEAGNPDYRAARNLIEIAEADVLEAGRRPNPVIAFEGEEYAVAGLPSFWNGQGLVFRVEQEIETARRRDHRLRVADTGVAVARSEVDEALRQLRLAVGRAYFRLALAQADRNTASATLDEIEQVIGLTEARVNFGEVAGTDLRRLQMERLHFVDQVFTTELAVSDARVALLAMLGAADLRQPIEAADPLITPPLQSPSGEMLATSEGVVAALDGLREVAVSARPDLRAARGYRDHAEAGVGLERALRAPNFTVGWGYRRDFGSNAMDFEFSVPIPLFGGLNPGGVERADAVRRRAESLEAVVTTLVEEQLQQAVQAVNISAERVRYVEDEYLRSATDLRELVQASYELGETALIDFLDVQREFLVTRQVQNQALYDLRVSMIELAAAVGIPPDGRP